MKQLDASAIGTEVLHTDDDDSEKPTQALDYARRLFADVVHWYDNADSKAQVLLTLSGVFLSFLSGSLFMKQDDLLKILNGFSIVTWTLFGLMSLTLSGAIVSALVCLWSRTYSPSALDTIFHNTQIQKQDLTTYAPDVMWFFQLVNHLDPLQFKLTLKTVDEDFEIEALASQICALSSNVTKKHLWVNRGFVLAGLSLILFLGMGISYLVNTYRHPIS